MKILIPFLIAFSVAFAQEKDTQEAKPAAETAAQTPEAAESPAAEGTSAPEAFVRGSVEVGYRFVGDIGGNEQTYRSVVNLGDGPRLLNLDLSMSPSLKWIDDLTIRGNSWGGDPYNTAYLRAGRTNVYRVSVDYRNIAYYNAMPSFANPRMETGWLANQRSFDMRRRYTDVDLELLPDGTITPFFGYTHNAGFGHGITLYVPSFNEYPVPTELDDRTDLFRGGVRFQFRRFHVTLEQGGFRFRDDQRVYEQSPLNPGNRTAPFLGQQLLLRNLQAQYDISGNAYFSRASLTANPMAWLDLFANWTYAIPKIDTNYVESATGNFAVSAGQFIPTQQLTFDALARQPHNRAHAGFTIRPTGRVQIIDSFYTDRLHTASTFDRLEMNYSQHQIEGIVDVTDRLSARVGHRYTWGDSRVRAPELASFAGLESGRLERNTGLAGLTYHWNQRLRLMADAEVGRSSDVYFRTSLRNYERVRTRARYQALASLLFTWSGSYLNNHNPNRFAQPQLGSYDLQAWDNSFAFQWLPAGGTKFRLLGEYAFLNWRSDMLFLAPQDLQPERSRYTENGHAGTLLADFVPARGTKLAPRFSAGGSFYRSSGSRPTRFWQPVGRVAMPLVNHVEFIGEWRYWGMNQPFFVFDQFRTNQATLSLRFWQ